MADTKLTGLTSLSLPSIDDLLYVVDDPGGTPASKKATVGSLPGVKQVVSTMTTAVNTGSTQVPTDDTIPQNTEGDEYMTLAITPKYSTSTLIIDVTILLANTSARTMTAALFQDSTGNALAANAGVCVAGGNVSVTFSYSMTSGTTSSTTFKVRAGANSTGTTTFNGVAGARLFGAITKSSIKITEIL